MPAALKPGQSVPQHHANSHVHILVLKGAARTALGAGTVVVTLLLAGTGVYELALGHAGKGILVSAAIEFLLAIGYSWILVTDKKDAA